MLTWLVGSLTLFCLGVTGMIYNWKNLLISLMCIEIVYLGAVFGFVFYGIIFYEATALVYALLILIFAACESAVGLGLLTVARNYEDILEMSHLDLLGG